MDFLNIYFSFSYGFVWFQFGFFCLLISTIYGEAVSSLFSFTLFLLYVCLYINACLLFSSTQSNFDAVTYEKVAMQLLIWIQCLTCMNLWNRDLKMRFLTALGWTQVVKLVMEQNSYPFFFLLEASRCLPTFCMWTRYQNSSESNLIIPEQKTSIIQSNSWVNTIWFWLEYWMP